MRDLERLRQLCVLSVLFLVGCRQPERGITMRSDSPIAPRIEDYQSRVVEDRYLLIPVRADATKLKYSDTSKSMYEWPIVSAWTELSAVLEDRPWSYYGLDLNLIVIDLHSGHTTKVFDRQVALGGFESSFCRGRTRNSVTRLEPDGPRTYEPNHDCVLRFPGRLILVARTSDTDGDRSLTDKDAIEVFTFDLAKGERHLLTPQGYSTRNVRFTHDKIILLVGKPGAPLSIFECDPVTSEGRFVAQDVQP